MWYKTLTGKSVFIKTAAGTDLSLKQTGEVVHKPTGGVVGSIKRYTDTPTTGTTTFFTKHVDGAFVYEGVYKKTALAYLAARVTQMHAQVEMAKAISKKTTVSSINHDVNLKPLAAPIIENEVLKQAFIGKTATKTGEVKKELVHGTWVVVKEPPRKHGPLTLRPGEKCGDEVKLAIAHPTLNDDERAGASFYTGNGYVKMNKFAAAGYDFTGAYDLTQWEKNNLPRLTLALREATRRARVVHAFAVLRDIPSHAATQVFGAVGSCVKRILIERRFTSTTKEDHDLGFGDVRLEYHLTPEAFALDVHHLDVTKHSAEREVILAPEQRFRVVSDTVEHRRVIVLESA